MPKIKTKKGAAKRFKVTANGSIKRAKANSNHILTKKAQKRKRNLSTATMVSANDKKAIARLIPYA